MPFIYKLKKEKKTMESGELPKENEVNNNSSNDIKALTEIVLKLQNKLSELELEKKQSGSGNTDLVKALAEFSAANEKAKDVDYQAGIRMEDIPEEDYDEKGVVFCAPFTGYAIADDRRKGHRVVLPYNKPFIFFEYEGTRRFQQGKYEQLMAFSVYKSQSKKEIAWLREHTFFNTLFYESTKGMMNFDVQKATKLAKIMTSLSNFELPQIISRCKEHNIPIGQDISIMKSMLAMSMAEKELESEQTSTQRRLMELEAEKEKLMAGSKA